MPTPTNAIRQLVDRSVNIQAALWSDPLSRAPERRLFLDDWEQAETGLIPERRLFVDDWEQASHGGELAHAVEKGLVTRDDVTDLGSVLAGDAPGRQHPKDITIFDSTGLAIQDLAIALAALERADEFDLPTIAL